MNFRKACVFLLETVVEPLGDLFHVESLLDPAGHVDVGERFLLLKRDRQGGELLDQAVTRLADVVGVFAAGGGLARVRV